MRRAYHNGKPRYVRYNQRTLACHYCDATIDLRYRTTAETPGEAAQDLYMALRASHWGAVIRQPGSYVEAHCPACKAHDRG